MKSSKRFLHFFFVFVFLYTPNLCWALEWGWRSNLDVNLYAQGSEALLGTVNAHRIHEEMYEWEKEISPYVRYTTKHSPNICMGFLTVIVQCSPERVGVISLPIVDEDNKSIIFCSQKASRLHPAFQKLESLSFSPKNTHPGDNELQSFIQEEFEHSKFSLSSQISKKMRAEIEENEKIASEGSGPAAGRASDIPKTKSRKSSRASSVASDSSSSNVFALNFQHTEQKLVYYLLDNDGYYLKDHINRALFVFSPDLSSVAGKVNNYYPNIIGLILHVHTRLDPCTNCRESLVLFKEKALDILNGSSQATSASGGASSAAGGASVSLSPKIEAPILVTVSSRARNDTSRETEGYDEHWNLDEDRGRGHLIIKLKPGVRELNPPETQGDIQLIPISSSGAGAAAGSASGTDKQISPNCHGVFPDVLQKPIR